MYEIKTTTRFEKDLKLIVGKAQEKAHEESARIIAEAKSEIAVEKQNAFNDIRGQVAELSVKVAEKILRDQLSNDEKQMELIGKLLDNVSSPVSNDK